MTYQEFWPFYLREHSRPLNRAIHYLGTSLAIVFLLLAISLDNAWVFLAAPAVGYGFAWFGHFIIEKNRPATFKYPLYSFISDFRMLYFFLIGKIGAELAKAGVVSKS